MEVKDVINILKDVTAEQNNAVTFNNLYQSYIESDDYSDEHALQLWNYMKKNHYLPEHLESDDDITISKTLLNIAIGKGDILAYKYALVILYHRFILSDILEKAFVSRILISCFVACQNITMDLVKEFISTAFDDILYKDVFEEDDRDVHIMHFEMIRAILPFIEWFQNEYQEQLQQHGQIIEGVDDTTLSELIELANSMHDKKSALRKFSAFCRYLNESIYS